MTTSLPESLDTAALSRRLGELSGHERAIQGELLLHLDEYDRRRAHLEAGFGSLWDYLTRGLHYREGAAYRRIRAMNALRRVPALADALRDRRLCLTTLAVLEPLLTPENAADLVARAAFASKADVEHLVASIQPRPAPKDGLRRLHSRIRSPMAISPRSCARRCAARSRSTAGGRAPWRRRGSGRSRRPSAPSLRADGRNPRPSCGARSGNATAAAVPSSASTGAAAGAPGSSRSTTWRRRRWADPNG